MRRVQCISEVAGAPEELREYLLGHSPVDKVIDLEGEAEQITFARYSSDLADQGGPPCMSFIEIDDRLLRDCPTEAATYFQPSWSLGESDAIEHWKSITERIYPILKKTRAYFRAVLYAGRVAQDFVIHGKQEWYQVTDGRQYMETRNELRRNHSVNVVNISYSFGLSTVSMFSMRTGPTVFEIQESGDQSFTLLTDGHGRVIYSRH